MNMGVGMTSYTKTPVFIGDGIKKFHNLGCHHCGRDTDDRIDYIYRVRCPGNVSTGSVGHLLVGQGRSNARESSTTPGSVDPTYDYCFGE